MEEDEECEIRESSEKNDLLNGNCDEIGFWLILIIFLINIKFIENSIENRIPLLYVDVNLGANRTERIVVFEGDESEELAERFVQEHGIS